MSNQQEEKKEVRYYGKKAYIINPLLIRRTAVKEAMPDFTGEDVKFASTNEDK